jgi:hypothetical protein
MLQITAPLLGPVSLERILLDTFRKGHTGDLGESILGVTIPKVVVNTRQKNLSPI